jgi:Uma2 family endonuclease
MQGVKMTALLERTQTEEIPNSKKPDSYWFHVTSAMFDQMIDAGVIDHESRVELLDGRLVEIEEMKPAHVDRMDALNERLVTQFRTRARISCQNSVELPQDGRPQPDFALVRRDRPAGQYTQPEDVYLLIEVSNTSLQKDRDWKAMIYARDGIQEYWILNLQTNQLEVHRDPENARYTTTFVLKVGQLATCLAFPDDQIDWFSGLE